MTTEIDYDFSPNPGGQDQFLNLPDDISFRAAMGGIGSGKTEVGAYTTAEYALSHDKVTVMVVAPTYDMLKAATLETLLRWIPEDAIKQFNRTDGRMELVNRSVIWLRSASNPQRLRGANLNMAWVDEAALVSEEAWHIVIGRVRVKREGIPSYVQITTTPKGRNWIYKHFIERPSDKHRLVTMPTKENAEHLKDDYLEGLISAYDGDFAEQELEGKFVTFAGLVYRNFDRQRHTFSEEQAAAWIKQGKFKRFVAGVDWGLINPGVILVFGVDGDNRMYLLEEQYQRRLQVVPLEQGEDSWLYRAIDIDERYKGIKFFCDPSEPQNIEAFTRKGLNAVGATNDIQPGISALSARLSQHSNGLYGWQAIRSAVNTLAELEIYHYADASGQRNQNEKPVKEADHAMDASRYAVMGIDAPNKDNRGLPGLIPIIGAKMRG